MLKWEVLDWKSFKFSIASMITRLVFVIELIETGSKFSTTCSCSCDENDWFGGRNIGIFSVSFRADNGFNSSRIVRN